jgi:hypothetical protein
VPSLWRYDARHGEHSAYVTLNTRTRSRHPDGLGHRVGWVACVACAVLSVLFFRANAGVGRLLAGAKKKIRCDKNRDKLVSLMSRARPQDFRLLS